MSTLTVTSIKLFSKHRSVREFIGHVSPTVSLRSCIKPYIESRIHHSLHIALNEEIPVYLQKTKITSLHPEDRLFIEAPRLLHLCSGLTVIPAGSNYSLHHRVRRQAS
ncbi:MAG: hypothetical protein MZV63_34910 [Marinilabiliales bacterium]|nr:hypothetical protein [Marinilabiliales bacterium]